jgi:hypothetical protein
LVAEAGTGTVGGIDSSAYTFWKNQFSDYGAATSSTIESFMLGLWLACARGDDQPDLIVAGTSAFTLYENSQTSLKRYASSDSAQGGFLSLKYKSADVIYDGGSGIDTDNFYFLNTDYIKLKAHRDANLSVMEEMRPINQDAAVIPVLWMGNMTCSNRARQGVLFT